MFRLVCLAIGYCFGLIQAAYLAGKLNHVDISTKGSGNLGTTNSVRVLGIKKGLVIFFCDALKWLPLPPPCI